uniref:Uncharacterized protein n=1 Tax=Arundo donax TaxID=35708 RepID=A0A0A9A6H6_ARUDO
MKEIRSGIGSCFGVVVFM